MINLLVLVELHVCITRLICTFWDRQSTLEAWQGEKLPCSTANELLLEKLYPTLGRSFHSPTTAMNLSMGTVADVRLRFL